MTTPAATELLKYADLQMAAEAFFVSATGALIDPRAALIRGNDHASKFTATQADNFLAHWKVIEQEPNTVTGFSGTLFKCIADDPVTGAKAGELVISFRSTEFVDDAARDNQATNSMEVQEKGWAFGQIDDMEAWYSSIKIKYASDFAAAGNKFAVTGYSLGGHLATAFNLLRRDDLSSIGTPNPISATYTFNGAGVGQVTTGSLKEVIDSFRTARNQGRAISGSGLAFCLPSLAI